MIHELKIFEQYFDDLISGEKTFEVRKNDRSYKVGDYLALNEYAKSDQKDAYYTGRGILCRITYIMKDPTYCKDGYVILGIYPCKIVMADWTQSPTCLLD